MHLQKYYCAHNPGLSDVAFWWLVLSISHTNCPEGSIDLLPFRLLTLIEEVYQWHGS